MTCLWRTFGRYASLLALLWITACGHEPSPLPPLLAVPSNRLAAGALCDPPDPGIDTRAVGVLIRSGDTLSIVEEAGLAWEVRSLLILVKHKGTGRDLATLSLGTSEFAGRAGTTHLRASGTMAIPLRIDFYVPFSTEPGGIASTPRLLAPLAGEGQEAAWFVTVEFISDAGQPVTSHAEFALWDLSASRDPNVRFCSIVK